MINLFYGFISFTLQIIKQNQNSILRPFKVDLFMKIMEINLSILVID